MKAPRALLGIDIGTSGLKASVFDEEGRPLASVYRAAVYLPLPPGHREQSAEQWWEDLGATLREIWGHGGVRPEQIAAVGICGFHHCPVFVRADGQPARPVMQLHDERLYASRADLEQSGVLGRIHELTGSLVSSGHFPPIYHYIATHDAEGLARTKWILLAKDYLRYRLTGRIGTEICDATGTNLIEAGQRVWSERLCAALGIAMDKLPPIAEPTEVAGEVTADAAGQTGLRTGVPVVYGGGDSHCAMLGLGCIGNGDTCLLLGTNSTLRTAFDAFVKDHKVRVWVQHHVVPECYTISASSMAGASVLHWFRENLCGDADEQEFGDLEAAAERIPVGAEGLVFLPYLYGERCPFYDPEASGAFIGLRHRHRTAHLLRAVLDGVAVNIANCFDLLEECARGHETRIEHLRLGGGGSRAGAWHRIISDALGRPIRIMNTAEAGALGAAMLAGVGVGIYKDCVEAAANAVRCVRVIDPDTGRHEQYVELKKGLNDLYQRIR